MVLNEVGGSNAALFTFCFPAQAGPATASREWKVQPRIVGQLVEIKLISCLSIGMCWFCFFYFVCESRSVVSDSLRPHGLYSPWNSLGQNTGVGSLSLLHGIFPTQGSNTGLLQVNSSTAESQGKPRHVLITSS